MKSRAIYGMPTLIECGDIENNLVLCKKLGLDFIELNMNLPQFQIERIDPVYYKRLHQEYGVFFTLHLPEELNIADFNIRVRNAYLETMHDSVEVAKAIGMPILNMHMVPGVHFKLPEQKIYLFEKYYEDYIRSVKEFADVMTKLVGSDGPVICIENTGIYDKRYICDAVDEMLKYECFALTWDVGHDHSSGCKDRAYILQREKHVKHVHLHDAIGEACHLPLKTGEIDIEEKLDFVKKNRCSCVIETKNIEGLKKSVELLQR